ncbi:MAG: hypothetical protein ACK50C_18820 [Gemmatimonadaceae bacterium]|jgi:hypothetical protein
MPSLSVRLALAGMVGLAALSGTHWLRERVRAPGALVAFVLGSMPNLAAGYAMPLVFAAMDRRAAGTPPTDASRRRFRWLLLFTTAGLVAWEFLQVGSARFRFDPWDIGATLVGAWGAFATQRRLAT